MSAHFSAKVDSSEEACGQADIIYHEVVPPFHWSLRAFCAHVVEERLLDLKNEKYVVSIWARLQVLLTSAIIFHLGVSVHRGQAPAAAQPTRNIYLLSQIPLRDVNPKKSLWEDKGLLGWHGACKPT